LLFCKFLQKNELFQWNMCIFSKFLAVLWNQFFGEKTNSMYAMGFVIFGHWNISVHNLHEQWCFVWKHFFIIWKKKHRKSLEDFVYIVWIWLIWAIFVRKILEFQYHKIETKNCCSWTKFWSRQNITTWWLREEAVNPTKLFGGEKSTILPYLEEKKVQITKFRPSFQACHQNTGFQKIILSSTTCRQIWLSHIVDNHQSIYLTKLEGKKPQKKSCSWSYIFTSWNLRTII
jgi:hypothetical protein